MPIKLPKLPSINLPSYETGFLNDFKNLKDDGALKVGIDNYTNEEQLAIDRSSDDSAGEVSKYATFCRVQIRKAKDTIEIPFGNIENFELIESQDNVMYYGRVVIKDPGAVVTDKYTLTGEETLVIAFGKGPESRSVFTGRITRIEGMGKLGLLQDNAIITIYFSHPMIDIYQNALPISFNSTIDEAIKEIMATYTSSHLEKPIITPTENRGLYTCPGLSLGQFLMYLRDLSISTRDEGAYSLFITRNRFYFVPRDYFNAVSPHKTITDSIVIFQNLEGKAETAIQMIFNIFDRKWDSAGIHNRSGWAYSFANSRLINFKYNLEDEKSNKKFLGTYTSVGRNLLDSDSTVAYTGFRNEPDLRGAIKNKSEMGLEKIAKALVTVGGSVEWEPGKVVDLNISHFDPDQDKNAYLSGLWVVNSVTHDISYETGYVCLLELYRNSSQSAAEQNLLLRA